MNIKMVINSVLFFERLIYLKVTGDSMPLTVIFNITNNCNLRCKHCYASYFTRSNKENMTTEQIQKIIKDLKKNGCLRINIAGGEPLLRSDVGEIIDYAKQQGLSVDLTSNGILVPQRLTELKKLDCLLISLDGKPEHHDILRGKGSAEKALMAIKVAKKAGIEVRVNMVIHKYNLNDISYMIGLAKKLGFIMHISLAINNIFGDKPSIDVKPTDYEFRQVLKYIIEQKKKGAPIFFSTFAYKSVLNWPDFNVEGIMNGPKPPSMSLCRSSDTYETVNDFAK